MNNIHKTISGIIKKKYRSNVNTKITLGPVFHPSISIAEKKMAALLRQKQFAKLRKTFIINFLPSHDFPSSLG